MPQIRVAVPSGSFSSNSNVSLHSKAVIALARNAIATNFDSLSDASGLATSSSSYATIAYPVSYDNQQHCVHIFKGIKPSQTQLDSGSLDGTFHVQNAANRLMSFISNIDTTIDSDPTNNQFLYTLSCDTVVQASASGVATWWLLSYYNNTSASYYDTTAVPGGQYMIGDISTTAGSGELKMDDVNIVSGQSYILTPFSFAFPAHLDVS